MMRVPRQNQVIGWRCFHCDEYFRGEQRAEAAEHFGTTIDAEPACKLNEDQKGVVGLLRKVTDELWRYRDEDSDLHRLIAGMSVDHARALRDEEEKGYERGLRDGVRYYGIPGAFRRIWRVMMGKKP